MPGPPPTSLSCALLISPSFVAPPPPPWRRVCLPPSATLNLHWPPASRRAPTNAWLAAPDSAQTDAPALEVSLRPAYAAGSTWKLGGQGNVPVKYAPPPPTPMQTLGLFCLRLPPLYRSPYNHTYLNTLPTNGRLFLWSPWFPQPTAFLYRSCCWPLCRLTAVIFNFTVKAPYMFIIFRQHLF